MSKFLILKSSGIKRTEKRFGQASSGQARFGHHIRVIAE
jgi:hypothetical protein